MTNNLQSRLFPTENASGTSHLGSLSLGRGVYPDPARWELRLNSLCRILEEGGMPSKGYFPSFLIFSYCHDICNNMKTTRKETAAAGDGWDSSKDPACVLAHWASLPRPPETAVGTGSSQRSLSLDSLCLMSPSIFVPSSFVTSLGQGELEGGQSLLTSCLSRTVKAEKQLRWLWVPPLDT